MNNSYNSNMAAIASPLSRRDIHHLTAKIRKTFGIKDTEAFPIVNVIELLPEIDETFNFLIEEDKNMSPNVYAEYFHSSNYMIIAQSVYESALNGNGRHRFTLAHELGHYILIKHGAISFKRMDSAMKIKKYCDPEWQADEFAGNLLVPISSITNYSETEIVEKYHVSYRVAEIQKNKNASWL